MLNFYGFGTGKMHIWLHGFLGNCLNLSPLARAVPGQHFLLDARNHGKSFHSKGMDYLTQAKDIIAFMDSNNISKANIIGHSMGGKTAMVLACTSPHRVEKLCILDIAPLSYTGVMDKYYGHIRKILMFIQSKDVNKMTRKEIENICQLEFDDWNITNLISSNLVGSEKNYTWRLGVTNLIDGLSQVGHWEDPPNLGFDGPTLALSGENSVHTVQSPLIPPGKSLQQIYNKYFDNIILETIPNSSHFIHVENPKAVKLALNNFLTQ